MYDPGPEPITVWKVPVLNDPFEWSVTPVMLVKPRLPPFNNTWKMSPGVLEGNPVA